MQQLSTIQKREKLNQVFACGKKGNGGAYHQYKVVDIDDNDKEYLTIDFQNGAREMEGSTRGVMDSDLLEIVRHRLQEFQLGQYGSRENAIALTHIEEALMWLNRRVEDRVERNVLGTMNK